MRKFPVGQLKKNKTKHLGVLINDLMVHVLRPFLEKWQAEFRHWWNHCDEKLRNYHHLKDRNAIFTTKNLSKIGEMCD